MVLKKIRIPSDENKAPISPYSVSFHFSVPSYSEQASGMKSFQKGHLYRHSFGLRCEMETRIISGNVSCQCYTHINYFVIISTSR